MFREVLTWQRMTRSICHTPCSVDDKDIYQQGLYSMNDAHKHRWLLLVDWRVKTIRITQHARAHLPSTEPIFRCTSFAVEQESKEKHRDSFLVTLDANIWCWVALHLPRVRTCHCTRSPWSWMLLGLIGGNTTALTLKKKWHYRLKPR